MATSEQVLASLWFAAHPVLFALALFGASASAQSQAVSNTPVYMKEFTAFQNKTLEQKVQELADREEIRELIARHAHRVAHGESFADLFTEDGVYINRYPNNPVHELRGRKAIAAAFDSTPGHIAPGRSAGMSDALPMIHNIAIEISGDEATGICSNELRITEHGKSIIASGYYQDRYRRENGRWKFALRDITFFHWVSLQEGWAKSAKGRKAK